MPKIKKRNEFRRINNQKYRSHPGYIYGEQGKHYLFYGLTHSPTTNNRRNMKLKHNPDPHDKEPSFMRPFPDREQKPVFGKRLKGWYLDSDDKIKIQTAIKNKDGRLEN